MRAVAKITEGYFLALGNPALLAKAIIGGALQEVSMEALMKEMQIEVEQESENLRKQNKEGKKKYHKRDHSFIGNSVLIQHFNTHTHTHSCGGGSGEGHCRENASEECRNQSVGHGIHLRRGSR